MGKVACWFLGMLTGIVVLAGAEVVVAAALPTKVYLNSWGQEVVGPKIADKGLLDIYNNRDSIVINDFPIVKGLLESVVKDGGLGDFVEIDYDSIKDVHITDPQLGQKLRDALKITATLKSLKVDLGNFKNLSIFSEWTPCEPTAQEIYDWPPLYYYRDANGKYKRAFNNDSTRVPECPEGTQLYKANLSESFVMDLFVNLNPRLNELTYKDFMVNLMGVSEASLKDNTIYKLLGDKKISELKDINADDFKLVDIMGKENDSYKLLSDITGKAKDELKVGDLKNIDTKKAHLTTFMDYTGNEQLFDALCDMTSKADPDTITLGDLDGLTMDAVKLKTVIPKTSKNEKMYNLLCDTTGKAENDLLVADLKTIDTDDVHLSTVLAYEGNEKLYSILVDMSGKASYDLITLKDLDGATTDNVKLANVLEPTGSNAKMYDLLRDLTGKTDNNKITVNDLKTIDTDDAHLSTFLAYDGNEQLYSVLMDMTEKATYDLITLGDLDGASMDKARLVSVLTPTTSNAKMYDLLRDLTGKAENNLITVNDLKTVDPNYAHLTTFIPYPYEDPADLDKTAQREKLYNVLMNLAGVTTPGAVTVGAIGSGSIDNVKLSSLLGTDHSDNAVLDALLKDPTVTVSNLATKIDALDLHTLFGKECFTTNAAQKVNNDIYSFNTATGVYTYDPSAETPYYISASAGMWLLLAYSASNTDPGNGRAGTFTPATTTFNDLTENPASLADAIGKAKVYQLISAKVITENPGSPISDMVKKQSLAEVLGAIS